MQKGGGNMTDQEKARAARAEYARRYRKEHPERIKATQEKYWLRRAEREKQTAQREAGRDETNG